MISFIICFVLCLTKLFGQPLNFLSPTQYRSNYNDPCGNDDASSNYYEVTLCGNALSPSATQMKLSLEIPDNPDLKPPPFNLICIQLSKCKDYFSEACVFAVNYYLNRTDNDYYAIADLVININEFCTDISNCTIYIRAMAQPNTVQYSMQLSFVNSKPSKYLNWTMDHPWSGPSMSTGLVPKPLSQFWQSDQIYQTSVNEFTYFYIGYCSQTTSVSEIEIAVTSPINNTITLLQTFACPKAVGNYLLCTSGVAQCDVKYIAPFVVLPCTAQDIPLTDGIYVVVQTFGNDPNQLNEFMFQAIVNP